jgi:hypothetical protein
MNAASLLARHFEASSPSERSSSSPERSQHSRDNTRTGPIGELMAGYQQQMR